MKPIIYLISGLGADERIFRNLKLEAEVLHLPWIKPLHQNEPLSQYADRMAAAIVPGRPGLVVGVSFGGMAAVEIAAKRPWLQAVEISSINDPKYLPCHLKLLRFTGLHKITPPQLLKLFPRVGAWYFGTKGRAEYQLFKQILHDTEPFYMRWAIHQLLTWQPQCHTQCTQIIGTDDTIFPPGCCPGATRIMGGSHLMVYTHAEEISQIINKLAKEWVAKQVLVAGA